MAKYRHRIFEMYDFRAEAIRALVPNIDYLEPQAVNSEKWTSEYLVLSHSAGVAHVEFRGTQDFGTETASGLQDDFTQLADQLGKDSKVLLDFAGVVSLSAEAINALVQFNQKLRIKGSRMVLCCLDPAARDCFFVAR